MLQHVADDILQHTLRQHHVVFQIGKGNLRLNHPELCRMAGRIGILRAEGRAKGVDILKGHRVSLPIELAADRQVGRLAKEILGKIHTALCILGHILQIEGRHLEHLPSALAVAPGNQRRMHIDKIPFLEKFVDGIRNQGTHPEYSLKGIRAGAQMGNRP